MIPRRSAAAAALIAALAGCGADDDDAAEVKTPMPLEEVPAVVIDTAKKEARGYTPFAASEESRDGRTFFEIKAKDKRGKVVELEIDRDGKFLGRD